jgi:hypothetical protein
LLIATLLFACEDESPERKYPVTLKLSSYNIENLYIYYGPDGLCDSIIDDSFFNRTWKSYLDIKRNELLEIHKDSVFFIKGSLKYSYPSRIQSDEIFIKMADEKWYYFGKWVNENFRHKVSFRFGHIFYENFDDFMISKKEKIGETSFKNLFYDDTLIKNPHDLVHIGDTIAWANVGYIYNIIK